MCKLYFNNEVSIEFRNVKKKKKHVLKTYGLSISHL